MQIDRQALIDDLNRCTVAIKDKETGEIHGSGVMVTDDGLILTCYHVIGDNQNKTLYYKDTIAIHFTETKIDIPAKVIDEYCNSEADVAFLKLQLEDDETLPDQLTITAAHLGEAVSYGHEFASIGFRKISEFEKLSTGGQIRITTSLINQEDGKESTPLIQLYSGEIEEGMSGAAVLDLQTRRVVGIVSLHYQNKAVADEVDKKLNFAIPISTILENSRASSELKAKNPGLKPIFEFLRKIELSDSIWYRNIDEKYVAPIEYDDIKSTLRSKGVVIITGPKEYGKTYTAIRLLWEYYNQGFEPKYIQTKEEEKVKVRERLSAIKSELKRHHIVYFEDPFGRVKYQYDEELERDIGTIIDTVSNFKDTYVIITSREEVFSEFENQHSSEVKLKDFEKKLNIKTPSYNYTKRREMLLRCAELMNCKWINNKGLRTFILNSMNDDRILPTPLNIKDFTVATVQLMTRESLFNMMIAKSKETAKSFAKEIEGMTTDKILVLLFPYIYEGFRVDDIEYVYSQQVNELKIENPWTFGSVFDHFKDTKIHLLHGDVRFSHPSYHEAIKYILSESRFITKVGEILSSLLIKLANTKLRRVNPTWFIARAVMQNFNGLSNYAKNLLFELAEDKDTAELLAHAFQNNFDDLPVAVRNELLLKLANLDDESIPYEIPTIMMSNYDKLSEETASLLFKLSGRKKLSASLASALGDNFDKLPDKVRNELLLKLPPIDQDDYLAESVSKIVAANFDKLSDKVRNELLLKLGNKGNDSLVIRYTIIAIASNYDKLPDKVRNLLFKFADNRKTAGEVANALVSVYGKLNENMVNLFFKLIEKDYAIEGLPSKILSNYDKLPDKVRNLLFKFADNRKTASELCFALEDDFDKLPIATRTQLLLELADKKEIDDSLANIIQSNFDKLPDKVRNEIISKLQYNTESAPFVISILLDNYDKLPDKVRNLIFKLADREAEETISHLASNYDKLPDKVRNLLFKLAHNEDPSAAESLARSIISNYDKLPDKVRNLLFKFADNEELAYNIAWALNNFDSISDPKIVIPNDVLGELLLKLADKKDAASYIARIIRYNFDKLSDKVRNELLLKLGNKGNDSLVIRYTIIAIASNYDKLPDKVRNLLFKFADNEDAVRAMIEVVEYEYDKIPENIRNDLFRIIRGKDQSFY